MAAAGQKEGETQGFSESGRRLREKEHADISKDTLHRKQLTICLLSNDKKVVFAAEKPTCSQYNLTFCCI